MSGSKPTPLKLIPHKKTYSQLPILSLSQLEKNYLSSKQKKKHQQQSSLTTFPTLENNHQILIKSPFYERMSCTNKKGTCKCQFHKRQKLFIQKLFPFQKKQKILEQFHLERLKSHQNSSPLLKKESSKNRTNTSVNETDQMKKKNDRLKRLIEENKELYIEFLKRIKQKKSPEVDCHNLSFQQFLKSNHHWILRQVKHKKTVNKPNRFSYNLEQQNENQIQNQLSSDQKLTQTSPNFRHYLRFKTLPSNFLDQDQNGDQNDINNKSRKKSSKFYNQQKKGLRSNKKKFTQISRSSVDSLQSVNKKQNYKFLRNIQKLKPQDRFKLQQFYQKAFQQIGLNYSEFKSQSIQNPRFFRTLCKNLINPDPKAVECAKNVLKRISKLPLNLYSTVLKEIKNEVQSKSPNDSQNIKQKTKQSVIALAFETLQNHIQQLVRNKDIRNEEDFKGKEKMSILGKLKNRYVARSSLNFMKFSQIKSKYRSPSSIQPKKSLIFPQITDSKKSRFATQIGPQALDQQLSQNQNNQNIDLPQSQFDKEDQQRQKIPQNEEENQFRRKEKQREIKKGLKMTKLKKNKNIIKMIDEQIQEQNNTSKSALTKKSNLKFEDDYEKERTANIKKLRDEEYRQHLQFVHKMREKSNQRQSSIIEESNVRRNSVKAHLLRHKMFIKKMQECLIQNSDLKDMIIHQEDNLFTKKRKVRILNQMIKQLLDADPHSQFYQDLKKYIEIFEKSCALAVKQKKDKKYKKLAKKSISQEDIYQQDYRSRQENVEFNMEQFVNSINLDKQLKFYRVDFIQLEQQDIDSIVKQFLSRPNNEKVKQKIVKENHMKLQTVNIHSEMRMIMNQQLVQVGLDNISEKIMMQKYYQEQKQQRHSECYDIEEESKQVRRLRERFRRNMQKYQKCFNLNRSSLN